MSRNDIEAPAAKPAKAKPKELPEMIVVNEKPPIWEALEKAGFEIGGGCIFTWENVIYNPDNVNVDSALVAHETMHCLQQAEIGGAPIWWKEWIEKPAFRAEMEAQGYGAQYKHFCHLRKDRNQRAKYLHIISGHLCSGMYRMTMTQNDARAAILKRS